MKTGHLLHPIRKLLQDGATESEAELEAPEPHYSWPTTRQGLLYESLSLGLFFKRRRTKT